MSEFIIDFGKYRNKNIAAFLECDNSYFKWLLKAGMSDKQPGLTDYLKTHILEDIGYVLTFGKHRNKPLCWVFEHDKQYCLWLKKNMSEKIDLMAAIQDLEDEV